MMGMSCFTLEEAQRRVDVAYSSLVGPQTGQQAGQATPAALALQRGSIVQRDGAYVLQCICSRAKGAKAGDGILNLKRHTNTVSHFVNSSSKAKHEALLRGVLRIVACK
jgi:hypothetical protein